MMNNTQKTFSIRDLENISGIKAHTIRIWEKRYQLFSPERTDTNIRVYSLESLQKLLNITLLYRSGYKISRIAQIPETDIPLIVREVTARKEDTHQAVTTLKMAMLKFDQRLFQQTFNTLSAEKSFQDIFREVVLPFLEELGLLWQTNTVSPAHEHFITGLIKQKIILQIDKLQVLEPTRKDKVFVLFLPENEIHEIGLLYVNYELALRGYKSVYLGATMPLDYLPDLQKYFTELVFISYFTVTPSKDGLRKYLEEFTRIVRKKGAPKLWILGQQVRHLTDKELPDHVQPFDTIEQLVRAL